MNRLTSLSVASIATLCLVWSGLASAGDIGPMGYTTMSRASVKIESFEQTGEGETGQVTVRTNDVINYLREEEPGTRVPNHLQLVLLNSCDDPAGGSAVTVWDRNEGDVAGNMTCLYTRGPVIFRDGRNTIYQQLNIDAWPFHMDQIDMDVEIKLGRVSGRLLEERPVCLKSLSTMTMSGYYWGEGDSRVMRKPGSIKTNGAVFEVMEGDVVSQFCDDD